MQRYNWILFVFIYTLIISFDALYLPYGSEREREQYSISQSNHFMDFMDLIFTPL